MKRKLLLSVRPMNLQQMPNLQIVLPTFCLLLGILTSCKDPAPRKSDRGTTAVSQEGSGATAPLTPLGPMPDASTGANSGSSQNAKPTEKKPSGDKLGCGQASFYGTEFAGQPTANGETFDPRKFTAAHRNLAFGKKVRVLRQGQASEKESDGVVVKINDRGPFVAGRIIDLSTAAFEKLASVSAGVASVCIFSVND